jgi:hypothetical protein
MRFMYEMQNKQNHRFRTKDYLCGVQHLQTDDSVKL